MQRRLASRAQLHVAGGRSDPLSSGPCVHLRSRNNKDFSLRYPAIVRGLARLPNETAVDGELVALDEEGRPSFGALQNYAAPTPVLYYVFDVMVLAGRDVKAEPLDARTALLARKVVPTLTEPVLHTGELHANLRVLIHSVKLQGLEGLVAKRRDSRYEPGLRSGAWMKMRINRAQEFVIGGYTIGTKTFDALIFGYYERDRLIYAARTRNGFTPALRERLFKRFRGEKRPLGTRLDRGQNAGVPLAETGPRRPVRIPGMDRPPSSPSHQVHRPARGQTRARRAARVTEAAFAGLHGDAVLGVAV